MSARPATAQAATSTTARRETGLTSPNHCRRLGKRSETGADEAASNPTTGTRRQQFVLTMPKRAANEVERHRLCPRENGVDDHLRERCVVPQPIQLAVLGGAQFFNG